jgi:hypothetical protein
MLEYMGSNDKVERFVLERKVLDKPQDGRTVSFEWNPMSLACNFVGIEQNIGPGVWITT